MSKSGVMVFVCVIAAAGGMPATGAGPHELGIDKRMSAQTAIEGVYWRHRIWPSGSTDPKPALDQVLPESVLRAKVEDYLLESKALEQLWGRPIRAEELQAEIERMVGSSRAPGMLQEIFAALGNDPVVIAECLARPLVADRLIRAAYARDARYHLALKTSIEQSLARHPKVAEHGADERYGEVVWVLGGTRQGRDRTLAGARVVDLDAESWRRNLARLQAGFEPDSAAAQGRSRTDDLPIGIFTRLQEDDESFFVQAVLEQNSRRIRVATMAWRKTPFDEWWARTRTAVASDSSVETAPTVSGETSRPGGDSLDPETSFSPPAAASCTPDTWTPVQTTGAPSPREAHTAIWTGTEMIVWGGYNGALNLDTNTGGRYTPATDSWTPTSTTGAAELRDSHSAVWTGTTMIVWGGGDEIYTPKNTGGRYNPTTNTWLATTTTGAPSARLYHSAVWTGARMVIWGGWIGNRDTDLGALYDPVANTWVATSRSGNPSARDTHTAIWTGTTMLVWGGQDDNSVAQGTGARFDPVGNAWSAMSATGAPAARWLHSAVWTGSGMIIWGGWDGALDLTTGGIYDPVGNAWTATSTTGAPLARERHLAVWADAISQMVVWGGQDDAVTQLNTGARYDPATGLWTPTSTTGAPICGRFGTGVWTGSEMIAWGGWNIVDLNTGGRYCVGACASPPPPGSSVVSVSQDPGGDFVSWTAVAGADTYDLVRGSLEQLAASGGDFTTSTQACITDDDAGLTHLDAALPAVGSGYWYLVRGQSCGGPGTYDSTGGLQVGGRDAEINASLSSCP